MLLDLLKQKEEDQTKAEMPGEIYFTAKCNLKSPTLTHSPLGVVKEVDFPVFCQQDISVQPLSNTIAEFPNCESKSTGGLQPNFGWVVGLLQLGNYRAKWGATQKVFPCHTSV